MKYHVGCGNRNFGDTWVHVDGHWDQHVTMSDITLKLVDSDSAELIYASHVLEYFDRDEAVEVLKSWHRVLKPEGVLRLAVPDLTKLVWGYGKYGLSAILGPLFGKMKMGKEWIYHKTVYDYLDLKALLEFAGFHSVQHYNWRETEHAHVDDHSRAHLPHDEAAIAEGKFPNHTLISLNLEATK